jgi:acetyltransferase
MPTGSALPPGRASALDAIDTIFHARSIAVVGATERPGYGARFVNTLIRTGYAGRIYPINPGRSEVFGLRCYPSPLELPETPDLAGIIVPAERVLASLRQCAQLGVRAAIVISAGFAELNTDEGRRRQAELRQLVAETGPRLVGPNCLGASNLAANVWATASSRVEPGAGPDGPGAALVSQSGATAYGPLLAVARDRGLAYRYIVTTGNEADLGAADFVEYLLGRPDVGAISLLLEGIRDFGRLASLAREALRLDKVLVILKVGQSEVGQRAARSHTAALTGSDRVQDALFRQFGIARVRDYDELVEQTAMLLKAPLPAGRRIGVVSHSGGIGAHLSDQLGVVGLEVPPFAERTRQGLTGVLGERGSANNPADITGYANSPAFAPILATLLADPGLDAWLIATQGDEELVAKIVAAARTTPKPLAVVWTGSQSSEVGLPTLHAGAVPVFLLPSGAARGMAALVRMAEARRRAREAESVGTASPVRDDRLLADLAGTLSEHRSKQVLARFGIPSPPEALCQDVEAAVAAAGELGYPVVLKASAPDLPHKSELGLVRLDLRTEDELRRAFVELVAAATRATPGGLDGVLVQPFVRGGVEAIVGLSDDPLLGRLVMLGLGGTLVEALGAVTWRACPIDLATAETMIDDVPALATLLGGVRGAPPADRGALARALVDLSALADRLGDCLETVDVNPLLVRPDGQGVLALDALVVLAAACPPEAAPPDRAGPLPGPLPGPRRPVMLPPVHNVSPVGAPAVEGCHA